MMGEAQASIELHACMTPNVLKVMLMLGELDLAYRIRHVRIYHGENFADGFEALHPYRKLPVLVDHDGPDGKTHTVFESGAILVYLAERHGRLLGQGPTERSAVFQWLMLQMSSVGPTFGNATHFNRSAPADQPYGRERFVTQAMRLCAVYDQRLSETPYLAGSDYTIADVATFPWLWRHPGMLGIDARAFPNIQRWVEAIRARPGFERAHGRYKALVEIDMEDLKSVGPDVMDRLLGRGDWTLSP